jgi:hypothetical protein
VQAAAHPIKFQPAGTPGRVARRPSCARIGP